MKVELDNEYVSLTVDVLYNTEKITITGSLKNPTRFEKAEIVAAAPPDRMANYTGSALPFPSSAIAFENTPNKFIINSPNFNITFDYPNSFYSEGGFEKVVSSVFVITRINGKDVVSSVELPDRNFLRTQTYRDVDTRGDGTGRIKGPQFYNREDYLPIPMTQYEQLINIGKYKETYNIA